MHLWEIPEQTHTSECNFCTRNGYDFFLIYFCLYRWKIGKKKEIIISSNDLKLICLLWRGLQPRTLIKLLLIRRPLLNVSINYLIIFEQHNQHIKKAGKGKNLDAEIWIKLKKNCRLILISFFLFSFIHDENKTWQVTRNDSECRIGLYVWIRQDT